MVKRMSIIWVPTCALLHIMFACIDIITAGKVKSIYFFYWRNKLNRNGIEVFSKNGVFFNDNFIITSKYSGGFWTFIAGAKNYGGEFNTHIYMYFFPRWQN